MTRVPSYWVKYWANQSRAHPRARGKVDSTSTRVGPEQCIFSILPKIHCIFRPNPWDEIPGPCNTFGHNLFLHII
eukprot:scaffold211837_cov79-Attheya_sp.AAC.4